ncbi:Platinum sensitivity protein [Blastocladiella emersonii ATCC 22665]|nr:Platinum sensitivity protein [Blastocladiella emersonii ATCC 22665]
MTATAADDGHAEITAAAASVIAAEPSRRRVKVYLLEEEDKWVDKGTGHITLPVLPSTSAMSMHVASELEPHETLLDTQVRPEIHYQRQEGTLIVWTEPNNEDWAVSFQEAEGCDLVWEVLHKAILHAGGGAAAPGAAGANGFLSGFESGGASDDMLDDTVMSLGSAAGALAANGTGMPLLPDPTCGNLQSVLNTVNQIMRLRTGPERLNSFVLDTDYVAKLADVFHRLEDLEATDDLAVLFGIVKHIVLAGDASLFNTLVSDTLFFDLLGMLEYDPSVSGLPGTFRAFMRSQAQFVPVLECLATLPPGMNSTAPSFATLAGRAYRLAYLKDVVVARYLDDPVFNCLSDSIRGHYSAILRRLIMTPGLPTELAVVLDAPNSITDPTERAAARVRRRHAALFLKELAIMTKQCPEIRPNEVYSALLAGGTLVRGLTGALGANDDDARQAAGEFIAGALDVQRRPLQDACLAQFRSTGNSPVHALVTRVAAEREPGMVQSAVDTLMALLEPETIPGPSAGLLGLSASESGASGIGMVPHITPAYDAFQTMFYGAVAAEISRVARAAVAAGTVQMTAVAGIAGTCPVLTLPAGEVERVYQIVELWHLLLKTHPQRFWETVLGSPPVLTGAAAIAAAATASEKSPVAWLRALLTSTHKHIQLAVVRFVRTVAQLGDDCYTSLIASHRLVPAIVDAVLLTQGRYNLVNSAALEFLESALTASAAVAARAGPGSALTAAANARILSNLVASAVRPIAPHIPYAPSLVKRVTKGRGGARSAGGPRAGGRVQLPGIDGDDDDDDLDLDDETDGEPEAASSSSGIGGADENAAPVAAETTSVDPPTSAPSSASVTPTSNRTLSLSLASDETVGSPAVDDAAAAGPTTPQRAAGDVEMPDAVHTPGASSSTDAVGAVGQQPPIVADLAKLVHTATPTPHQVKRMALVRYADGDSADEDDGVAPVFGGKKKLKADNGRPTKVARTGGATSVSSSASGSDSSASSSTSVVPPGAPLLTSKKRLVFKRRPESNLVQEAVQHGHISPLRSKRINVTLLEDVVGAAASASSVAAASAAVATPDATAPPSAPGTPSPSPAAPVAAFIAAATANDDSGTAPPSPSPAAHPNAGIEEAREDGGDAGS